MIDGDAEDAHAVDDPTYVVRGSTWDVAMVPGIHKKFQKFPIENKTAIETLMEYLGEVGPQNMPPHQLNREGRHPRGDGKVLIRAFKDGCYRSIAVA